MRRKYDDLHIKCQLMIQNSNPHAWPESRRRFFEEEVERAYKWVRWGIETPDGEPTWQLFVLALLLPWAIGVWL